LSSPTWLHHPEDWWLHEGGEWQASGLTIYCSLQIGRSPSAKVPSKLPRRQQDKIVEFLAPIVEEFKRKTC
jgi:hypothetical protein